MQDLCEWIYPNLEENHTNKKWLCTHAIPCPTIDYVDKVNHYMTTWFPGQVRVYWSSDRITEYGNEHRHPTKFPNSICVQYVST